PFSCLPARTGSGRARKQVKGLVPCGFSGQRPEPSESFLMLRSAIFKVLLSLFFSARFFIDHLTLPIFLPFCPLQSVSGLLPLLPGLPYRYHGLPDFPVLPFPVPGLPQRGSRILPALLSGLLQQRGPPIPSRKPGIQ